MKSTQRHDTLHRLSLDKSMTESLKKKQNDLIQEWKVLAHQSQLNLDTKIIDQLKPKKEWLTMDEKRLLQCPVYALDPFQKRMVQELKVRINDEGLTVDLMDGRRVIVYEDQLTFTRVSKTHVFASVHVHNHTFHLNHKQVESIIYQLDHEPASIPWDHRLEYELKMLDHQD